MSNMLKSVTVWMHPSPAPKSVDGDDQEDGQTPRGVKRKPESDPEGETDNQEDAVQKTPSGRRAKSRISSETPGTARRGRPSSAKRRRSESLGARNENPPAEARVDAAANLSRAKRREAAQSNPEGEKENPMDSLVPVADMGNADELLGHGGVHGTSEPKSSSKADANDKGAAKDGEITADAQREQEQGEEHEVKAILDHRAAEGERGAIELLVHWVGETKEEATWEPEEEIQKGAAETLYDYWKSKGGRGRALFNELQLPEEYRVFKVLRHERRQRGGFHLEVQWVGYSDSPVDTTWEAELKLKTVARGPLDEYWDGVGGRGKFLARRGRSKKAGAE
ncbi:hypothetical protein DL766_001158 [Monosporascus sp. MC13-8B]|uniref:Chromo domain-containing protein n=1 Tax=Monosporascus cannonballus TaxID=155416 RepID=A0ABY0HH46_9PEZI|nr:hypothetical protein DL762_002709 [Monosporascus cannonballus]RYO97659.1 hypothetical protein DL763_002636 [Monosporascus cannonballus]RYP38079.1 hypothetical protein DL766_001158 [Monosporascus sp. MC13-8B]